MRYRMGPTANLYSLMISYSDLRLIVRGAARMAKLYKTASLPFTGIRRLSPLLGAHNLQMGNCRNICYCVARRCYV